VKGFVNFIYFNVIVYVVYAVIDKIFTFLGFYNTPKSNDMLALPSQNDMYFVIANVLISTILGYYLLGKFKNFMEGK